MATWTVEVSLLDESGNVVRTWTKELDQIAANKLYTDEIEAFGSATLTRSRRLMHVDDVIEGIFHRLCLHEQDSPLGTDRSMGLPELRLALGVTEARFAEALWVLSFPGDKRIEYPSKGRTALGADWRERCERQSSSTPQR
jgi:hypothetical protein